MFLKKESHDKNQYFLKKLLHNKKTTLVGHSHEHSKGPQEVPPNV